MILASCTNKRVMTFADFVDIDKIEEVRMSNNSGTFNLTTKQLNAFKKAIGTMTFTPYMSAKVGAIGITVVIDGHEYVLLTATHGDYLETSRTIVTKNKQNIGEQTWLYFKTNGINFDNYKRE